MKCNLCAEVNVGPEHEISLKHLKNKALHEYSVNRKLFAGNRKGAVVKCNVKTTFINLNENTDARIKISAKPNEVVKFNFVVLNESKKENMNINFIQIPQNELNFIMNDNSIEFGCTPVLLKAKNIYPKPLYVQFRSPHIGQYEMPIIFSFYKIDTRENIVIVRDMVVYVELKQAIHQKVTSPYARKEVMATDLVKMPKGQNSGDLFRIPKNYKPVYASGLKVNDNTPEDVKLLTEDIKDIFNAGITKDNYVRFFHNLLWYEETIIRINLKKYNMSGVMLEHKASDCLGLLVPGLAEKRPSLMLGDILFIKPQQTDEIMFEAEISEINENHINIKGLHQSFWKYYNATARFDIRFFMSRMPLERMHCAVNDVFTEGQESRVFPVENRKPPVTVPVKDFYNLDVESNPEQRLAVEKILAGTSGTAPYLLHGPPGTGKTVTIVEAILQLVNKNPNNRIMVCTDSNMAADHVATILIKYKHMFSTDKLLLRANSKYRVWETLPECLHPYSNGSGYNNFEPVSIEDFKSYHIVIATLSHAAKFSRQFRRKKVGRPISHLFIDEAAQASEPSCLIPAVGLLRPGGALVLAGDPLQLGPVVISHNARTLGLGLSLMERLKKTCPLYSDEKRDPNYVVMLLNNFRSDQDILHIPNMLFYNGELKALAKEDVISKKDILGEKAASRAIIFHGVLSKEQKMGKSPSFYNDMEVEILQMYVGCLISDHYVRPEDIGIVAPYIRQVYKIKKWLQSIGQHNLEVGTVEAFQGKEKRVIIISTVRANCNLLHHDAKFQLGFLVDDKRFNVALTRAKAKAIIIGNPMCLEKDLKWLTYIQQCREFGTYFGFDTATANSAVTQKELLDRITPLLKDLKVDDKTAKGRD